MSNIIFERGYLLQIGDAQLIFYSRNNCIKCIYGDHQDAKFQVRPKDVVGKHCQPIKSIISQVLEKKTKSHCINVAVPLED